MVFFPAVISNNFIPRPPTSITTTRSTTSTTTTTTTTTTSTTTSTTTTTTSTTTTTKPEPEENNEVIRGRKVNSLVDHGLQGQQREQSGGRGRVKILVRHKKRPSQSSSSELLVSEGGAVHSSSIQRTSSSSTTSAENKFVPKAKGQQQLQRPKPPVFRRQRVRFMPTQIEVRTEKSVRTATSKSFSLQRPLHLPSLFSKRNGLLAAAIISGGGSNETITSGQNNDRLPVITKVADEVGLQAPTGAGGHLWAIRSFCRRPPMEKDDPHCFRPEPLYFYNVTSASCEPFFKGHCARSRNKFESVQTCQERCLVTKTTSSGSSSSTTSLSKDTKSQSTTSGQKNDRLPVVISSAASAAKTSSTSASSTPRPSLFKSRLPRRRGIGLF